MFPHIVTTPKLPGKSFPIAIIGTGGIVKDAHLPAYKKAGFPVWGLMDKTKARADALAAAFSECPHCLSIAPRVNLNLSVEVPGSPCFCCLA